MLRCSAIGSAVTSGRKVSDLRHSWCVILSTTDSFILTYTSTLFSFIVKLCTAQALVINTPFLRKLPGYFSRTGNFLINGPKQYSTLCASGVPRNFFSGGGFNKFSWGQRRANGDLGGGSPLVRGSGGRCHLVQEISLHIVNFSWFLVL
jgi:hypothetical protein